MQTDFWRQVEELFQAALAQPPDQREQFINERTADHRLRDEVKSLLNAAPSAEGFLEGSPISSTHEEPFALIRGQKLGGFEVLEPIGRGGMGEVYRARDLKLGRDVALKILPEAFLADADRLARFHREAKVLALINHPNIATLYGFEETGDIGALVMELVEGPTLAELVSARIMSLDEALPIAKQMSEALEYAHERGIIHRDLKPANVKLTPDRDVKVLDFGLAKLVEPGSPENRTDSTRSGVILGTASYMSPEQARGEAVDKRADIWAFGAVLLEMLSGERTFCGNSVSETIAAVLTKDPNWETLPRATPPAIRKLLRRCLERDRRKRLRDIGEARIIIEECLDGNVNSVAQDEAAAAQPDRRQIIPWAIATFILAAVAMTLALLHLRETRSQDSLVMYNLPPPKGRKFGHLAISPNGRSLAFAAADSSGKSLLFVRELDFLIARSVPGTEGAWLPFWSPDSRFIGFWAKNKLRRIEAPGGEPQIVGDAPQLGQGAWNRDGVLLYAPLFGPIYRISAGGESRVLTQLDQAKLERGHFWPRFLPDGQHFLYTVVSVQPENSGIYVGSLDSRHRTRLIGAISNAIYVNVASGGGHLLFWRDGYLMAQRFDAANQNLSDDAQRIASASESVDFAAPIGLAGFTASDNGVLAFISPNHGDDTQWTWLSRTGARLGTVGPPGYHFRVRLSPDEKQAAIDAMNDNGTVDIWLIQLTSGASTRLTFARFPQINWFPVWSPDKQQIVFSSNRQGGFTLFRKSADGSGHEQLLLKSSLDIQAFDWSPDGRFLLYSEGKVTMEESSLWVMPLFDGRKPFPLQKTGPVETDGAFSADGRWIAYVSNESGRQEVYVRPFPDKDGPKWQVSVGGGFSPKWQRDSRELFYRTDDTKMMAVEVSTGKAFRHGVPKLLFQTGASGITEDYAVTADGRRFLIPIRPPEAEPLPMTVIINWNRGLKQ